MERRGFLGWLRLLIGIGLLFLSGIVFLDAFVKFGLGYSSLSYVEAPGTITQSELKTSGDKFPIYKPTIRYSYCVDGKSFDGERFSHKGPLISTDQAWAEGLMARFPLGQEVVVYVDQRNPTRSVLERGMNPHWKTRLVIGLVLLGAGLWITHLLSYLLRFCRWLAAGRGSKDAPVAPYAAQAQAQNLKPVQPPQPQAAAPPEDEGPGLTRKQGWLLGGGLGAVGFVMCIAWIVLAGIFMQESKSWPSVSAVVTRSEVTVVTKYINGVPVQDDYSADITYSYTFDGASYESDNVPKSGRYSERVDAQRVVAGHPLGTPLRVFVNPNNAGVSTLQPGEQLMYIPLLLTGLLAILLGVAVILGVLLKRPMQKLLTRKSQP